MTTTPSTPSTAPTWSITTATAILLGLGAVLGAMAVVFVVLGLWQHEDSLRVCGQDDVSTGECLVTADLAMREERLIWVGALTLAAGSATALGAAAVSTVAVSRARRPD